MELYKRLRATHTLSCSRSHIQKHTHIQTHPHRCNDERSKCQWQIYKHEHTSILERTSKMKKSAEEIPFSRRRRRRRKEGRKESETVTVLMFVIVVVVVLWNVVCEVTHIIHTNSRRRIVVVVCHHMNVSNKYNIRGGFIMAQARDSDCVPDQVRERKRTCACDQTKSTAHF